MILFVKSYIQIFSLFFALLLLGSSFSPISEAADPDASSILRITFIDVGEGDSALLECEGRFMLIDGGRKDDSQKIYAILKTRGVQVLDYIIATHPHEDHIGGLPGALSCCRTGIILCNVCKSDDSAFPDFEKKAAENGTGITIPCVGETYPFGSAEFEILAMNSCGSINDDSMIIRVRLGDFSLLFMADAESAAEKELIKSGIDLSSDVLKIGHHGAENSTSTEFLAAVSPRIAVISTGRNNQYQHPAGSTLQRLANSDAELFRTDLQGDIDIETNGRLYRVSTEKCTAKINLYRSGSDPGLAAVFPVFDYVPGKDAAELPDSLYFIGNKNSMKLHLPSCDAVKKMSEKNKEFLYCSKEEAMDSGFVPCQICRP